MHRVLGFGFLSDAVRPTRFPLSGEIRSGCDDDEICGLDRPCAHVLAALTGPHSHPSLTAPAFLDPLPNTLVDPTLILRILGPFLPLQLPTATRLYILGTVVSALVLLEGASHDEAQRCEKAADFADACGVPEHLAVQMQSHLQLRTSGKGMDPTILMECPTILRSRILR